MLRSLLSSQLSKRASYPFKFLSRIPVHGTALCFEGISSILSPIIPPDFPWRG
jgi:hypothetical protein